MRAINRTTKEVLTLEKLRERFPNISFVFPLTPEGLEDTDFTVIDEVVYDKDEFIETDFLIENNRGLPVLSARPLTDILEKKKGQLTIAVQKHLDSTAQSRGYDNIISLCTYAVSTKKKFQDEAIAGIAFRDACWEYCYQVYDDVLNNRRNIPTEAELLAELPTIQWPS